MTELQKIELDILCEVLNVCEKLDLTYYLVCGSALGAVKYQGFIPWDDDIDIALPRNDYEIFIKDAPKLLPTYYFVQNYKSDPQFHLLGTKVRDSRTTYIEKMCRSLNINHGVFIDVFPLDGMSKDKRAYKIFKKKRREFEGKRRVNLEYNRLSRSTIFSIQTNLYYYMNRFFGLYADTQNAIKKFEDYIKSYNIQNSDIWCNYANSISINEFAPKEQYGKGCLSCFEGIKVYIPEKYDEYLTQKYGNWRADLPLEQQVGHHYYEIMDLKISYTEYMK